MPLKVSVWATEAEKALADEFNRLHVRTQVVRFFRVYASTLGAYLALVPHGAFGPKAAAAIAVSIFETVVRQLYPALPLDRIVAMVDQFRQPPRHAVDPAAPAVPDIPSPRTPEPDGTASDTTGPAT